MKSFFAWFARWRFRTSRLQPSARLTVAVVSFAVALFAFGDFVSTFLILVMIAMFIIITAVDCVRLLQHGVPTLVAKLSNSPQLQIPVEIIITVQTPNTSRFWQTALERLQISPGLPDSFGFKGFVVSQIRAVEQGTARDFFYTVRPLRRGIFGFHEIDLRWLSRLGLWQRLQQMAPVGVDIRVLPDVTSWRKPIAALQQSLQQNGRHNQRLVSGNTAFSFISDYTADDNPRHINWAATARRHKTMKNVYEPERGQHVILAIDASRYMGVQLPDGKYRLDHVIDCASAIVHAAQEVGDSIGVLVFSSRLLLSIPPGRGQAHEAYIIRALSEVEPESVQGGYQTLFQSLRGRFAKRSLLIVLSELEGVLTDASFLPTLSRFQRTHPTLFVTLQDITAMHRINQLPQDVSGFTQLAAAQWTLQTREEMMRKLRSHGVVVVESGPRELIVDTVINYLRRRQKFSL